MPSQIKSPHVKGLNELKPSVLRVRPGAGFLSQDVNKIYLTNTAAVNRALRDMSTMITGGSV